VERIDAGRIVATERKITRNSSGDEIANVNYLYNDRYYKIYM